MIDFEFNSYFCSLIFLQDGKTGIVYRIIQGFTDRRS